MKRWIVLAAVLLGAAAVFFLQLPRGTDFPLVEDKPATQAPDDKPISNNLSDTQADEQSNPRTQELSMLRGIVQDQQGKPLAGMEILLCTTAAAKECGLRNYTGMDLDCLRKQLKIATSQANGSFQFTELPTDEYLLFASGQGKKPSVREIILSQKTDIHIEMQDGLAIYGKVVDAQNQALLGANIMARSWAEQSQFYRLPDTEKLLYHLQWNETQSSEQGQFALGWFAPGTFMVEAQLQGFVKSIQVGVRAGTSGLVLVLSATGTLLGNVTDPQGNPVPNADLNTYHYYPHELDAMGASAISEENGHYQLDQVKSGGYAMELLAQASGFALQRLPLPPLLPNETRNVDITLQPATSITGKIIEEQGNPIAGAQLLFHPVGAQGSLAFSSFTSDVQGQFAITQVEKETLYSVEVFANGYADKIFQPIAGGAQNLELILQPLWQLQAQLVSPDQRREFDEFFVQVFQEDEHGGKQIFFQQYFPAGDGSFAIADLDATANTLSVWVPGFAPTTLRNLAEHLQAAQSGKRLEILLSIGKIARGTVIDASNQQPIAGAEIIPLAKSQRDRLQMEGVLSVRTDQWGKFQIQGVGNSIGIQHPDYATRFLSFADLRNKEWQELDLGNILLSQGGSILVYVKDPQGQPMANVEVGLRGESTEWFFPGFTDERGEFAFSLLEPGAYTVSVRPLQESVLQQHHYATSKNIIIEQDQQTTAVFDLQNFAAVKGQVIWPQETKQSLTIPESAVFLQNLDDGSHAWGNVLADGSFFINGVRPGETLAALKSFHLPQRVEASQLLQVIQGAENVVEFDLQNLQGFRGTVVDAHTGSELVQVILEFFPAGSQTARAFIYSQADGSFGIVGLRPGAYTIQASKPGYANEVFGPYSLASGAIQDLAPLSLKLEGQLQVIIKTRAGAPITGAQISLGNQRGLTTANGSFVFGQLLTGIYQPHVAAQGFANELGAGVSVEEGKEARTQIVLRQLCTLQILLEGESDQSFGLQAYDVERQEFFDTQAIITTAKPAQIVLPEGEWKLILQGEARNKEQFVLLKPGQENVLHIVWEQ